MAEDDRGHGFLAGLIIGGLIGTVLTFWLVERKYQRGRRRVGTGGLLSEFASFVKEDIFGGVKEVIRRASEEGRETAESTRADIEERLRGEDRE